MLLFKNKFIRPICLLIIFTSILLILSCEETLNLRIPESDPMITLNCILNEDEPIQLEVTSSQPYPPLVDSTLTIKDASVILYEDGVFIGNLFYKESYQRRYESGNHLTLFRNYQALNGFSPKKNHTYSVFVSAPNFREVSAETFLPDSVPITSIDTSTVFTQVGQNLIKVIDCTISFSDPPDKRNFYLFSISRRGLLYESPLVFENPGTSSVVYQVPFLCNDLNAVYYKFPVGFWGFPVPGSENEEAMLYKVFLSDDSFNGMNYTLKIQIDVGYLFDLSFPPAPGEKFTMRNINFKLFSIDEAYYKYALSNYVQVYKRDDIFSEPVIVYNNIKNGVGIFSGTSVSLDSSILLPVYYPPSFK